MNVKKIKFFSRLFQWLLLLTFLTPFMYTGCSQTEESAAVDTCSVAVQDTLMESPVTSSEPTQLIDSTANISEHSNDDTPAEELSSNYPALKPFLVPEDHTFTGVGLLINLFDIGGFISLSWTFLFIFSCGLSKLLNKEALATHLLLNLVAFISLLYYAPPYLGGEVLWGFWFSLFIIGGITILDGTILFLDKRNKNSSNNIQP